MKWPLSELFQKDRLTRNLEGEFPWGVTQRKGPYQVVLATPMASKLQVVPKWIDLSRINPLAQGGAEGGGILTILVKCENFQ